MSDSIAEKYRVQKREIQKSDPNSVWILEAINKNPNKLLKLRTRVKSFLKNGEIVNIDAVFDNSSKRNSEMLKNRFRYAERIWKSFEKNLSLYQIPEKSKKQLRAIVLIHSLGFSLSWEAFKKYKSQIEFLFYPTFTENELLTIWMMAHEINLLDTEAKKFRNMLSQGALGGPQLFNPPLSPEENVLMFKILTGQLPLDDEIRTKFPRIYDYFNSNPDNINHRLQPKIQEIISSGKLSLTDITLLHRALVGDPTLTEEELKNPILYTFYPPLFDIKEMLNIVRNHDLESIIFGALKLTDKINYPAENEGFVKIWQDCMMMLHFYAPVLELAGFRDMANECNSVALDFLNRGLLTEEEYSNLKDLHTKAVNAYTQYNLDILKILSEYASKQIKAGDFLIRAISSRVKTIGSAGRKLWEKYRKYGTVPDWLGFKVVIDTDPTPEYLGDVVGSIIEKVTKLGFELGHSRVDKPISVMLESIVKNENAKNVFENQLSVKGISKDFIGYEERAYQAIHLNFRSTSDPSITCEIQITDLKNDYINNLGRRSHILYKAKKHSLTGNVIDDNTSRKFSALGNELYERRGKLLKNITNSDIKLCPYSQARLSEYGFVIHPAYTEAI